MRVFVSHSGSGRDRAAWAAQALREAGYDVDVDLDWTAQNFVARMREAVQECQIMVALYAPDYFAQGSYSLLEIDTWLARPQKAAGLVPVRLSDCEVPHFYRPYVWVDLFGMGDGPARQALLAAVRGAEGTLVGPVPRQWTPPQAVRVWSVPPRNPNFVGRHDLLAALRQRLVSGSQAVVQALHGWGGVGKTSLAIEYAYRYADEYDSVWWVDAEKPELIGDQIATLAVTAGIARVDTPGPEAAAAVREHLRTHTRWLLIFDNVEKPEDVRTWLPGGGGHVVITSRHRVWAGIAAAVEVDVFTRAESKALLVAQAGITDEQADQLAETLGDLPLAVAQAAGLLASTGMPVRLYQTMLSDHALRALEQGRAAGYPVPLAASISLSLQRLAESDTVALAMIRVAALLAPEPLPVEWFLNPPASQRPPALRTADTARLFAAAGELGRLGLARPGPDGLLLHRLTQAVIADSLSEPERAESLAAANALVVATKPDNGGNPLHWPVWQRLLPHLLALDPATNVDREVRSTALDAGWYQECRGDYARARALAERLHSGWRTILGPDDLHTLSAANTLAGLLRLVGQLTAARALQEETLAACRRVFGEDHPETLRAANNLAATLTALGDHAVARTLHEQTLAARRRILGDDHPITLLSANNLAATLHQLGDYAAARAQHEQALAARRRILGDDHPDTLLSASNLASTLHQLGDYAAARALHEQALAARRRILGDDHPDTLTSASNLAGTLRALGEAEKAAALDAEFAAARERAAQRRATASR